MSVFAGNDRNPYSSKGQIQIQIKKGDKVLSFNHNTFQQEYKEVDNVSGELKIKVKLRENFANLKYAYVVTNLKKIEINQVESTDTINKDPHNVQQRFYLQPIQGDFTHSSSGRDI